ncbi:hypothetical protein [Clostridium sp. AWRP]|uniref:hypothetical protein n=1 Tax=Clostridium sp. AWRP TaxID=2212991 RepID=UPI000FDB7D0C|nr:hypothetical protein [Clostridium sp. AWRP]AZV57187.1 hypothetical protein DMR38_11560 [Clostridium sp. AWRP]
MHKNVLWISKGIEYLLTEIMIVSIVENIFPAFTIDPLLTSSLAGVVLCSAVPLCILNLCFFSKKSSMISLFVWAVLAVVCMILAGDAGIFSDLKNFEYSYAFYIIIFITAIITFIASKFRWALITLFIVGIMIFSALTVLAYETKWVFLVAFLISTTVLFAFEFYYNTIKISHAKKSRPFYYTVMAFIFCLTCMAASVGGYSIVQTANFPVQKPAILSNPTFLKIAEEYGFATLVSAPPKSVQQSRQNVRQQSPTHEDKNIARRKDNGNNSKVNSGASNSASTPKKSLQKKGPSKVKTIRYLKKISIISIIVAILIVIMLTFILKKLSRVMWYKNLLKTDRKHQVIQLYYRILKILSAFGYKKIISDTPLEFACQLNNIKSGIYFENFNFIQITNAFTEVNYGGKVVKDNDYNELISFYKRLLFYCRKDSGIFKFVLKYLFV